MKMSLRGAWLLALLTLCAAAAHADPPKPAPLLIVADEIPAMETLARQLEARVHRGSEIIKQDQLPARLGGYQAVLVYIHKDLAEATEAALLDYAEAGGKLILLHHSISSGKRKNKRWFAALGVALPEGDFAAGGYKYFDDATWDIVNLAPKDPVTTKGVKYPAKIDYAGAKGTGKKAGYRPEPTEVYVNHVLTGPRTPLLGLRYEHPGSGKVYVQDTAGWVRAAGKGRIYYFMPGHHATDFDSPLYAQILANAVAAR
jgi:hypothetical protein